MLASLVSRLLGEFGAEVVVAPVGEFSSAWSGLRRVHEEPGFELWVCAAASSPTGAAVGGVEPVANAGSVPCVGRRALGGAGRPSGGGGFDGVPSLPLQLRVEV